jgi:cation-transporting ATPase E
MQAAAVGGAAYAAVLTAEARKFTTTSSELMGSIMKFVRTITWVLIPLGILLFISQMQSSPNWQTALSGTVAGVVTMVPEGLVLLTSIAMAVAVVRLGQKQALVQEMPAVEVLARVNVVCVDKTGTLTQPGMAVTDVVVLDSTVDVSAALGALGASEDSPNPTLAAVKAAYPQLAGWAADEVVPFSSARKWSAAQFTGHGWWVFGAPEMILPNGDPVRAQAEELSREGSRVLLFAQSTSEVPPSAETGVGSVRPVALVVIDQRLRPDAAETVSYFIDQGVQLKVISGDNPLTVGAIAAQAGIPGADHPYDARELPDDLPGIAAVLDQFSVFGRVTPAQKRAMVGALQSQGHTVAMTGDGVNDVLALKDADLGIAMGSGAGATRAVAQIVLLNDEFSVMPSVVAEGRRVLGNIERVSDLFLTKSFYAAILSFLTVFFTLTKIYKVEFLFLPRHLTVITALSIGIPAFLLALLPNTARFRPGFFNRVLRFSVPAGVVCAVFSFASYAFALQVTDDIPASRVSAAITLFIIAWTVLFIVARPMNPIRWAIVLSMAFAFLCVLFIPWLANFFALRVGLDSASGSAVLFGLVGSSVLFLAHRWAETGRAEKVSEMVNAQVSSA